MKNKGLETEISNETKVSRLSQKIKYKKKENEIMETILRLLMENPENLGEVVKSYITKYKEPVYDVLKELMVIMKDYSENTEYPAICAKIKKNTYDAYVNVGFTEDQALALMINDNIRLMENIKKSSNRVSAKKNK